VKACESDQAGSIQVNVIDMASINRAGTFKLQQLERAQDKLQYALSENAFAKAFGLTC